jgi:hypothetical protein
VGFFLELEWSAVLIGNGRTKMEETGDVARLQKFKIGQLQVLDLQLILFGIPEQKTSTGYVFFKRSMNKG